MTAKEQIDAYRRQMGKEPTVRPTARQTMQQMYGVDYQHKCKDCKHLVSHKYARTYHKCGLWLDTPSAATDIKVSQDACAKWEPKP